MDVAKNQRNFYQLDELVKGDEAYGAHAIVVANISTKSPNSIEYQSYMRVLCESIESALKSNTPESLLSVAIVFPILSEFLNTW
jgi:hypothetical protein